jgi:cell division protein FtsL
MTRKNNKKIFFTSLFLTPYFFTLACLIIIAVIILPVYKNAVQRLAVNSEVTDLQKQIKSLESSNNDLTALKKYLQSDQFAEKEARLDFNLKKQGENVAVIENSGAGAGQLNNSNFTDSGNDKKNSNPRKWWNYFFGS